MTFDQFTPWALAQTTVAKYNDGQYPGECVSLINQLCWRVLNIPADAWGHAKDWGRNSIQRQYFDVLPPQTPIKPMDTLVYGENFGGGLGHVEIALNSQAAIYQNRNVNGLVGTGAILPGYYAILRRKEDEVKIGSENNWRSRFNRLHRQLVRNGDMSDEVFRSIVGKDAWSVVQNWSDHSESSKLLQLQELGELAQKDSWQQQIYDLQKGLANANQALANAQTSGAENTKELEKVRAENTSLIEKYDQISNEHEKDKQAGESFIRRIGHLIAKYLPK